MLSCSCDKMDLLLIGSSTTYMAPHVWSINVENVVIRTWMDNDRNSSDIWQGHGYEENK